MKNRILQATILLILPLLLVFTWAPPALAQGPTGDQVVLGDNLVLKAEEKIEGDVVVFGGNVTMPASSEIDGDLVVFGGNAIINGTVTGDIGIIGGNLNLGKTAVVEGDIGYVGGNAEIAEGAVVEGDVEGMDRFGFGEGFSFPPIPPVPPISPVAPDAPEPPDRPTPPVFREQHDDSDFSDWGEGIFGFFKDVVEDIAVLLSLAVISWLVAAFMPEQMRIVNSAMTRSAPLSFGLGLLTVALAGALGLILLITICLAFVPLLGFILLGIATLFGWIVAGQIIGERLLGASGRPHANSVGATVLGTTVLSLVAIMPVIGYIPCIGWLFNFVGTVVGLIIAFTGLGAVILTRFGTQPYPPQDYAFAGGGPAAPRPAPTGGSSQPRADLLASLERSEAELRAKIDAALAEADAAAQEKPVEVAPIEAEPEPDQPSDSETPDQKKPKPRRRKADDEGEQNPA